MDEGGWEEIILLRKPSDLIWKASYVQLEKHWGV